METSPAKRYIVVGKSIYTLTQNPENELWYDECNVLWALRDDRFSLDEKNLCGIDPFSLPDWHIFRQLNEICAIHDYLYSSPAYQYYHGRSEAEAVLYTLLAKSFFWFVASPFTWLAEKFGPKAWENERTRDK